VGDADRDHDQPQLRAQRGDGEQHEDDLREGEHDVVRAHQHVVDPAARVGRHEADHDAEHDAEDGGRGGQPQHGEATVEEAAEHVAAQGVGPEHRGAGRAAVGHADERGGGVRGDERPEHRDGDDEGHDGQADARAREPQRVAQDAQPRALLQDRRSAGDRLDRALKAEVDGGVDRSVAHRAAVLSRGVTKMVARSASRLSAT
jgi:hypothetical protein